jgi:hypothetical protein
VNDTVLSGVCSGCGKTIWLQRTGVNTWKWLSDTRKLKTWRCGYDSAFPLRSHEPISIEAPEPETPKPALAKAFLLGGLLALLAGCNPTPSHAEGIIPTPWGWRAAPCCREYGIQGYQGRPPLAFMFGSLAAALAEDLMGPVLVAPPPYPPPPARAYPGPPYGPYSLPPPRGYRQAPPQYAPAPPPPVAQARPVQPGYGKPRGPRFAPPCPDGCPRGPDEPTTE